MYSVCVWGTKIRYSPVKKDDIKDQVIIKEIKGFKTYEQAEKSQIYKKSESASIRAYRED